MPTAEELNIPDKLDSILTTKQAIHDAIVAKGVEVPEGTVFREYADLISQISGGGSAQIVVETYNILLGEVPLDDSNQDLIMLLYQNGRYTFTVTAAQGETLLVAMVISNDMPLDYANGQILFATTSEPNTSAGMPHPEAVAQIFFSSTECEFRFLDPMDLASSSYLTCYIIKSIN